MGLFGKKKASAFASGSGEYVAPSVSSPIYVAEQAEATAAIMEDEDMIQIDRVSVPSLTTVEDGTLEATNQFDVEEAAVVEEGKATETPVSMMPTPHNQDQVTFATPQPGTFDEPSVLGEATYKSAKTCQTFGTVRTTESMESKDTAFTITRNGQYLTLNGFANGHLMRWKFAAEEGPAILRIPAVFLALGVIGTTLYPIIMYPEHWTVPNIINAFHTCVLSSLILILEARVLGVRNPTNFRARVRGVLTRYINLLKLLWGRGLLYIFTASMNLTIDFHAVIYTAFPMLGLGVLAIASGAHASYNLDRMKSSLTDEAFLWAKFEANDTDQDNKLDLNGFAELLWSLGLEFDDVYTYKAFQQIDRDGDLMVTFEEFKKWWIVTQNDGRRLHS
jgi:hypothetical protein